MEIQENKQTSEFFLITLPGLEDLVAQEVMEWMPKADPQVEHGGVTLHLPLEQGLSLNRALKLPTRILLRVTRFKCRDFPKLFQKVSGYKWSEIVDISLTPKVHASSSKSRLSIKKRIEKTCLDGWQAAQKKANVKTSSLGDELDLYVRIHNDTCTLSLDTSGERLHKRGSEKQVGQAPLRETIAAGLIQMLSTHYKGESPVELIDPMMGAGTFLIEAARRDELISRRSFSHTHFKSPNDFEPQLVEKRPAITKIIGFESDLKTFKSAQVNWKDLNLKTETQFYAEDFFKSAPLAVSKTHSRWVVCNPPYGKRIKVTGPLKEYYENLLLKIEEKLKPNLVSILIPSRPVKGRLKLPLNWKVTEKRSITNGGIPVTAYVFTRV